MLKLEAKDIPILFKGDMVLATIALLKSQTRRTRGLDEINADPDAWRFLGWRGEVDHRMEIAVFHNINNGESISVRSPYGAPGDRLWVREAWRVGAWDQDNGTASIDYRADGCARREWLQCDDPELFNRLWIQSTDDAERAGLKYDEAGEYHWSAGEGPCRWRSSIHMPRWASRLTLVNKEVRLQRVQEISEEDAIAEGGGLAGA